MTLRNTFSAAGVQSPETLRRATNSAFQSLIRQTNEEVSVLKHLKVEGVQPEAEASGTASIAIGVNALALDTEAIAIGSQKGTDNSIARGPNSISIGSGCEAYSTDSIAIGENAKAGLDTEDRDEGRSTVAIGDGAAAEHDNSIAFGRGTSSTEINQVSFANGHLTHMFLPVWDADSNTFPGNPQEGMLVYRTFDHKLYIRTDTSWVALN